MIRYDGSRKDTLRNIEATREFVVNVVSEEIAQQMNLCSPEYPPDVDEFQVAGLTPLPSDLVRAPASRNRTSAWSAVCSRSSMSAPGLWAAA